MPAAPPALDVLLIVDPQVDFCPGGALAVPGGDSIFPTVNQLASELPLVIASRDWHPPDHVSFSSQGGPWPVHCQAGTAGAKFHPELNLARIRRVFSKGTESAREAYSAFDGTDLAEWLRREGVRRVLVAGLATDYCVRATVLDALAEGLAVTVLEDGIGAVDVTAGDGARALEEMRNAGAVISTSQDLGIG